MLHLDIRSSRQTIQGVVVANYLGFTSVSNIPGYTLVISQRLHLITAVIHSRYYQIQHRLNFFENRKEDIFRSGELGCL